MSRCADRKKWRKSLLRQLYSRYYSGLLNGFSIREATGTRRRWSDPPPDRSPLRTGANAELGHEPRQPLSIAIAIAGQPFPLLAYDRNGRPLTVPLQSAAAI